MRTKIYRISYAFFTALFYYVFLYGYFTIDLMEHVRVASQVAPLAPVLMPLIAMFFTPFIIGTGLFLFLRYPRQKKGDLLHYCLIYPGFAIFVASFLIFLNWLGFI